MAEYGEESYETYDEYDADQSYGVQATGQTYDKGNFFQFYHKLKKLNQVEMNKQELIFLEKLGLHVLATLIEYF